MATGPLVAIDLETTGLFPETDRIVEVAGLAFDHTSGHELARFESLVDPERPMSPAAEAIHGISDLDLIGAEPARVVLPRFFEWLDQVQPSRLLAHHARFDAGFLGRELTRAELPLPSFEVTDTLSLARRRCPRARTHQLDSLAADLGFCNGRSHRAFDDCRRVQVLWIGLQGDDGPHFSYRIFDPTREEAIPSGWEPLAAAIRQEARIWICYSGGTRGAAPREITPKKVIHKGGAAYLLAHCHLDAFEKSFRLDRILAIDPVGSTATSSLQSITSL